MMMKKTVVPFLYCLLSIASLGLSTSLLAAGKGVEVDRIVAVVNESVITQNQLNQKVTMLRKQLAETQTPIPSNKTLQNTVLQQMIDMKLQLQLAQMMKATATDAMVDQAITNIAKEHGATLPQLRETLAKEGLNYKQYREDIRDQITIAQLQQRQMAQKINISDAAVAKLAKTIKTQMPDQTEYHVEAVLVPVSPKASPAEITASAQQAQALLQKFRTGIALEQANTLVLPGQSNVQYGDLDWHKRSELPDLFVQRLPSMKSGDITDPIQAPNGFHIVKLVGVRQNMQRPAVSETHARHILIKTDALTTAQSAKSRLEVIKVKLEHGADFAELATANSQDVASAQRGGDLGWMRSGKFVPEFERVMNKLKVNQISQPFPTEYGWHIVEVLGHRQVDDQKGAATEEARQILYKEQFEKGTKAWIEELRKQAYIKQFTS